MKKGRQLSIIQLSSVDGSILKWKSYRDIYLSLVHKNNFISDEERFQHLISSLSGDTLAIVAPILLSTDNYTLAWDSLSERLDNKRLFASALLDKLFVFKPLTQESLPTSITFVNIFKTNVAVIKLLGVNDLSSCLLFHMCSRILDSVTLQLFESSISQ